MTIKGKYWHWKGSGKNLDSIWVYPNVWECASKKFHHLSVEFPRYGSAAFLRNFDLLIIKSRLWFRAFKESNWFLYWFPCINQANYCRKLQFAARTHWNFFHILHVLNVVIRVPCLIINIRPRFNGNATLNWFGSVAASSDLRTRELSTTFNGSTSNYR